MKQIALLFSLTLFIFLTTSCSSDADDTPENCSVAYSQAFEDELLNISNATQTYSADPSTANCEAFKAAYNDYLDALDNWEECAIFYNETAQWQQAIDATRVALDGLMC